MTRSKTLFVLACLLAPLALFAAGQAADAYTVETFSAPPPAELAEPIRAELTPEAFRIKGAAGPLCEIWFRKSIPTEAPTQTEARSYPQLPDTVLLGAMRVIGKMRENKGNPFPAGVYVMRHGLQPQNGDHAGSTEFVDFALLLNAKNDRTIAGEFAAPKDMIERSLKDSTAEHPIIFALLPPRATPGATLPSLTRNKKEHWVLEVKAGGLPLAMVIVGVYEH